MITSVLINANLYENCKVMDASHLYKAVKCYYRYMNLGRTSKAFVSTIFLALFGIHIGLTPISTMQPLSHTSDVMSQQKNLCTNSCQFIGAKRQKLAGVLAKRRMRRLLKYIQLSSKDVVAMLKIGKVFIVELYRSSSWIPPDRIMMSGLAQTSR